MTFSFYTSDEYTTVMYLPDELIRHIMSFIRWKYLTVLVSREWLSIGLCRRVRLRSWRGKVRMFSYLKVFGPSFVGMSWKSFCNVLGVYRRARYITGPLRWKIAAEKQMYTNRCCSCGASTRANVFGRHVCCRCRFNPSLKYSYMLSVKEARSAGVSKRILDRIDYHIYRRCHLRFMYEIEDAICQ